jgi:hypothetical protein
MKFINNSVFNRLLFHYQRYVFELGLSDLALSAIWVLVPSK